MWFRKHPGLNRKVLVSLSITVDGFSIWNNATVLVKAPARHFTPSSICLLTRGPMTSPALA